MSNYQKAKDILLDKGIKEGKYLVKIKDIKLVNENGSEVLKTVYTLQEPYLVDVDGEKVELNNIHIKHSANCDYNVDYMKNKGIMQMANIFDLLGLRSPDLETFEFLPLIEQAKKHIDKEFTANISIKKNTKGTALSYNVYKQSVFNI